MASVSIKRFGFAGGGGEAAGTEGSIAGSSAFSTESCSEVRDSARAAASSVCLLRLEEVRGAAAGPALRVEVVGVGESKGGRGAGDLREMLGEIAISDLAAAVGEDLRVLEPWRAATAVKLPRGLRAMVAGGPPPSEDLGVEVVLGCALLPRCAPRESAAAAAAGDVVRLPRLI